MCIALTRNIHTTLLLPTYFGIGSLRLSKNKRTKKLVNEFQLGCQTQKYKSGIKHLILGAELISDF